jgi:hypothetical protein
MAWASWFCRVYPNSRVEFTGAHLQLHTTLASAKAEMDAAAKAAAPPVPREPEAPSLFAPQAQPETTAAEEEVGETS